MALTIGELGEARWRAECELFDDFNYCQEWSYVREMSKLQNAVAEYLAISNDEGIVGLAAIRVRKIPFTRTGFAFISRGPMVLLSSKPGSAQLDAVLDLLRQRYVKERKLCLQIHPAIQHSLSHDERLVEFSKWGSVSEGDPVPYRTYVIDLSQSLEELRSGLHRKWRGHLKVAEGRDLSVDAGMNHDLLARFDYLYEGLYKQKSFNPGRFSEAIHAVARLEQPPSGYQVLIVREGSEDLAGAVISLHGKVAVYLLGARSQEALSAGVSSFVQWKIIKFCKAQKFSFYDLGGVDIQQNPGVEHFKRRIGGMAIGVGGLSTYMPSGLAGVCTRLVSRVIGRS